MSGAAASQYTGRFAPSPTGPLHFGSLIAALASYADARSNQGRWLLRIEDLDPPRETPGAADSFPRMLEHYGFTWDAPILRQSTRDAVYRSAMDRLRKEGKVFACACTRAQLERAPMGAGGERVYPGTCRTGVPPGQRARSWRVRVGTNPVAFTDRVQGRQAQDLAREVGDFVLRRADGLWAYQLAVVVDDSEQGITDVVRGADLLASTPRQIWLQQQLNAAVPRYAHVPVAVNSAGEKLSKQTMAAPLPLARPHAVLCAAWRFLNQVAPEAELTSAEEFWQWAIPRWDAQRTPRKTMLLPEPDMAVGL